MNAPIANTSATTPVVGHSHQHESARAQVLGVAPYLDDLPELRGTLYAAPILSTIAHGTLHGVDTAAALAMPGVEDIEFDPPRMGDFARAAEFD